MFRIASVTTQFTAAAILRLAACGKLALDDDSASYIDYPTRGLAAALEMARASASARQGPDW